MIRGRVTAEGQPIVTLYVGGREWPAIIDTGFNGDLELPYAIGPAVQARAEGTVRSTLATGAIAIEESYIVQFPFDGRSVEASATFAQVDEILIGTRLMSEHRLEIDFVAQTVTLERVG